ncbi:hypothetical protein [Desulfosoma sp.]
MQGAEAFWPSPVQLVFDTNILVDALLARGDSYAYAVQLMEEIFAAHQPKVVLQAAA